MAYKFKTVALQHDGEHAKFVELLKSEGIKSYLEIGSMYGGSFWRVRKALPVGSRMVAVDQFSEKKDSRVSLLACVTELNVSGYNARLIVGNCHSKEVIEQVREMGPYDCVFIDCNHSLKDVTLDWENYGPMAKIVAFHDISSVIDKAGLNPIEVRKLWLELREKYRHQEIELATSGKSNGIGVLWR